MNKIVSVVLASAVSAAVAVPSFAGSFESTGIVESVNTVSNTILIQNGDAYKFSAATDLGNVKPGQRVSVSWDSQNPTIARYGASADRTVQVLEANGVTHAN